MTSEWNGRDRGKRCGCRECSVGGMVACRIERGRGRVVGVVLRLGGGWAYRLVVLTDDISECRLFYLFVSKTST